MRVLVWMMAAIAALLGTPALAQVTVIHAGSVIRDADGEARNFLQSLRDLGLTLHELKADGELTELKDDNDLIARHQGRRYTNLVGRKQADRA